MVRGKRDVTKEPKSAKSKNKDEEESSTSDSEEYDLQDIMAELKSQRRDLVIRLDRLEKVTTEESPMKINWQRQTNHGSNNTSKRKDLRSGGYAAHHQTGPTPISPADKKTSKQRQMSWKTEGEGRT